MHWLADLIFALMSSGTGIPYIAASQCKVSLHVLYSKICIKCALSHNALGILVLQPHFFQQQNDGLFYYSPVQYEILWSCNTINLYGSAFTLLWSAYQYSLIVAVILINNPKQMFGVKSSRKLNENHKVDNKHLFK